MVVPHVLRVLEQGGISKDSTIVLISTGLHRESTPDEIGAMLGKEIAHQYHVVSHKATEDESHFFLGETSHKIPAFIDARYVTSDVKVLIGIVEPHLMAGYSGGRKLICPGLCSDKTIHAVHAPRLILEDGSREGVLDGNPVHEQMMEVARMTAPELTINLVVSEGGKLHSVSAGSLVSSHREAVEAFNSFGKVRVPKRFKIVVTSGGGHPLDSNFYQAIKGVSAAQSVAEENGSIILAASCSEGLGSESFAAQVSTFTDTDSFIAKALAEETETDQWMIIELLKAKRDREIVLVNDILQQKALGKLPITVMGSVEEALFSALKRWGQTEPIAVLPVGPYVLPEIDRG
jgi:nickel-dependent lactate racemase